MCRGSSDNPQPPIRVKLVTDNLPAWITPELIQRTIEVWQPFYEADLTAADAVTIVQNVGRLFDVLNGG